ncbi:hypothetical protein CRUP_002082 [Coryphaenoides rupestris]|nr:hypothetical protein CRUP_002082 [Coryphaenoides rupestris]
MRYAFLLVAPTCTSTTTAAAAAAPSDVFDAVLGNTEDELYACQRGCRLFSICQFVGDSEDLNQTKAECESTCHEAYVQPDERYACNLGCQNQLPIAAQRQEQLLDMMPRIHMLYPLALVRGFLDDFMNQAHSLITSSWTFYLQADDGKVVIFQVEIIPHLQLEKDVKEMPDQSVPSLSLPVYKDYQAIIQERDRDMFGERSPSGDEYNFFTCLSRNPWLPGWILTTTLVLSVLVLIWICCATMATAVDQYVPVEKLSISGDMDYMKEQKLTPYPASSLLIVTSTGREENEEEAGPLPTKVNLEQSNI